MKLHAIGFGSLNLDEFWEVPSDFLTRHGLQPSREYVRDVDWFLSVYPSLRKLGSLKACDPGGSAANMIAALSKMGFRTGFYGVTGKLDAGALRLTELGSPTDVRISLVDLPAGRCLALIDRDDPARDRALVILPNANDLAGSEPPTLDYFQRARWAHFTSFVSDSPLSAQVAVVRQLSSATRVSFDPGAVYAAKGIDKLRPILERTNILFTTPEELETLMHETDVESSVRAILDLGVETIVLKMGARGIKAIQKSASAFQPAIAPREIKDRTGAGDVAAAGFMAGRLTGLDLQGCLRIAAAAASKSIEGYGRSTYPDAEFVEELQRESRVQPDKKP